MNLKKLISTLYLSLGFFLILLVNAIGACPRFYKVWQHPVGPDTVSVYTPTGDSRGCWRDYANVRGRGGGCNGYVERAVPRQPNGDRLQQPQCPGIIDRSR